MTAGDDRANVYKEGQWWCYRASSLGGCLRGLVAARLGYESGGEVKGRMAEIFEEGRAAEEAAVVCLENNGWRITRRQDEINLFLGNTCPLTKVVGHIDGVVEGGFLQEPALLEIKSYGGDGIAPSLMARYEWQMSVYMHATGLQGLWCLWDRTKGTWTVRPVLKPYYSLTAITERILEVEGYGEVAGVECTNQYPCPYFYLHDVPDLVHDELLAKVAEEYLQAKRDVDEAGRNLKEIREELEGMLGDDPVKKTLDTGVVVTRYDINRVTYDHKAMVKQGIDLRPFEKTSKSHGIRVYEISEEVDSPGQT